MAEKYTPAQRDKLPESAFCGPDKSFPVVDAEDAHNALQALGRAAPGDRAAIRACVLGKARAAGWDDVPGVGKAEAAAALEYKVLPAFAPTSVTDRQVVGVFSVFGNVDSMDDVCHPGSFTKTFQERGPGRTLFLWQHDLESPPIAVIDGLREIGRDALPADVQARFPEAQGGAEVSRVYLDTPRGNEVLAAIHAGAPLQQSYGYRATKFDFATVAGTRVRHIREQAVPEVSDVNLGANDATRAQKAWLDLPTLLAQLHAHLTAYATPPTTKAGARHSAHDLRLLNDAHHLILALGATACKGEMNLDGQPEPDDDDPPAPSRAAAQALTQMKQRLAIFDLEIASTF